MILGEISWAYVALVFAWAGSGLWPGPGQLYFTLRDHASPVVWTLALSIPAVWLMLVSLREWNVHRLSCAEPRLRWSIWQTEYSAMLRGRLCLTLLFSWGYMLYVSIKTFNGGLVATFLAAGGVVFMAWFYKENRRVRREIRNGTAVSGVAA